MTKDELLNELAEIIADLGNTEPIDFDLIGELERHEGMIYTATPDELLLEGHFQWLEGLRVRLRYQ